MAVNPALVYNNNKILTATQGELTLMLYEGAIKFCNIAISAIEKKDIPNSNKNIIKAENIILELKATLNMDIPVAKEFDTMYNYIYSRLVEANIKKDTSIIEEVLQHLRMIRDMWKEVMTKVKR